MLLEASKNNQIDLNAQSLGGETALYKAASNGHQEIVQMLIQAGSNPFIKDVRGFTAEDLARINHRALGIDQMLKAYMEECKGNFDTDMS